MGWSTVISTTTTVTTTHSDTTLTKILCFYPKVCGFTTWAATGGDVSSRRAPKRGEKKADLGQKTGKKESVICRVSKRPWKGKRAQNLGQKMAENGQNVSFLEPWCCWRLKLSPTGEEMTPNFAIFGQNWAKRAKFPHRCEMRWKFRRNNGDFDKKNGGKWGK